MTTTSLHPDTIALHGGNYRSDKSTNSVAVPIIASIASRVIKKIT